MSEWNWPQYYFAVMYAVAFLHSVICNGEPRTGKKNGAVTMIFALAAIYGLYTEGFWK